MKKNTFLLLLLAGLFVGCATPRKQSTKIFQSDLSYLIDHGVKVYDAPIFGKPYYVLGTFTTETKSGIGKQKGYLLPVDLPFEMEQVYDSIIDVCKTQGADGLIDFKTDSAGQVLHISAKMIKFVAL